MNNGIDEILQHYVIIHDSIKREVIDFMKSHLELTQALAEAPEIISKIVGAKPSFSLIRMKADLYKNTGESHEELLLTINVPIPQNHATKYQMDKKIRKKWYNCLNQNVKELIEYKIFLKEDNEKQIQDKMLLEEDSKQIQEHKAQAKTMKSKKKVKRVENPVKTQRKARKWREQFNEDWLRTTLYD